MRIHLTFFLMPAWFGWMGYQQGGWYGAAFGVAFILLLFLCVLLHEYGHSLTARGFGIRTVSITMLPIGGLARLERMPRKPAQELVVALAGPFVNVVIAGGIVFYFFIAGGFSLEGMSQVFQSEWSQLESVVEEAAASDTKVFHVPTTVHQLLLILLVTNIVLVLFNMIPAFPMDGGRVFRALLAIVLPYVTATAIAAGTGQFLAFLGGFLALQELTSTGNPFPLLIAIFIFLGAGQEANAARSRETLRGMHVSDAMVRRFQTLSPRTSLGEAADALLLGAQSDFPIMQEGKLVGMLTRSNLIAGLRKHGPDGFVEYVMADPGEPVLETEALEDATIQLNARKSSVLPVVAFEDGPITGMLTTENLGELMMVRSALKTRVRS